LIVFVHLKTHPIALNGQIQNEQNPSDMSVMHQSDAFSVRRKYHKGCLDLSKEAMFYLELDLTI
jgi:hypothetical protein